MPASETAKRIAKRIRSIGWSGIPAERQVLEAYARAADAEVSDLIARIVEAVKGEFLAFEPTTHPEREEYGAYQSGVSHALAAIRVATETQGE